MDQPDDALQPPEKESTSGHQPPIEPATTLNRSPAPRQHLKQLGWALLAGLIILAALWGIFFRKAPTSPRVSAQPTPAFPVLNITSNVGFGTVTVNGVQQSGPPPLHLTMQTLPPYTITINAPPFRTGYCVAGGTSDATPPPDVGGNCGQGYGYDPSGKNKQTTLFVAITFTLEDLPQDQQSAIAAMIPQLATVSQKTSVPAQSYIATSITPAGVISTQRASGTLQATATFAPSMLFNQPPIICKNFICSDPFGGPTDATPGSNSWAVGVPVALSWRFTDAAGKVVGQVSLPYADLITIFLAYDQAQGWHIVAAPPGTEGVADQVQPLDCSTGVTMLQLQTARLLSGEGWEAKPLTSKGVEGCLLDLQQNSLEEGHFLWRFGVIMAADDKAHTTLPSLPVAPQDEIAAVSG